MVELLLPLALVASQGGRHHPTLTQSRSRPVALTYHDVTPRKTVWFDCTPGEFRSQIDAMTRAGARFVSLAQVEASFRGTPLPKNAVAITFADNYRGFLVHAYPLLKARRIPVAMFVHTGFVGSKVGRPKMTWEELRRLDREGVCTIGSQTVTHRDLDKLPDDEIDRELRDSKRSLEVHLGHSVRFLAYPNGAFDARCEAAARRVGYALAFSEIQKPFGKSPYRVERYVHTKWRQALKDGRIR